MRSNRSFDADTQRHCAARRSTPTLNDMKTLIALACCVPLLAVSAPRQLTAANGPEVSMSFAHGRTVVEYCPDNTCERYSIKGENELVLADFALAYLYGISEYVYLREFQARTDLPEVKALFKRYRTQCPQSTPRQAARCVAMTLARSNHIKASFVRYDEGAERVERISVEGQ